MWQCLRQITGRRVSGNEVPENATLGRIFHTLAPIPLTAGLMKTEGADEAGRGELIA